jgi:hypothetical protein
VVDQIRVDHVLQVSAPVVGKEDVDCFGCGVGFVGFDTVVDAMNYVGVG